MGVKLLPVLVILTAITVIGINGNYAYAESGVAQISEISSQGGVGFDVLDPDGTESVVFISNTQGITPLITENIPDPSCPNPLLMSFGFFTWPQPQNFDGPSVFEITDCSIPPVTYSCDVFHPSGSSEGRMGTCTCIENCDSQQPTTVGGEFLPIKTTSLLLAGTYSAAAWMIPIIVSAVGIGIVISRKF